MKSVDDEDLCKKVDDMLKDLKAGNKVCLLKRALYGLRQAGRSWHKKLDKSLQEIGVKRTNADPCVYRTHGKGEPVYILIYVDDILIVSKDESKSKMIKSKLARDFEMKDSGDVKYCLGIEFSREGDQIFMNQRGYIKDILKKFGMEDSKPASTPMDASSRLDRPNDEVDEEVRKLSYRELMGSLMYLAVSTRPDIAHVVSALSQFNENFDKKHWAAAKRVLCYLKSTIDTEIMFKSNLTPLNGYVDSD